MKKSKLVSLLAIPFFSLATVVNSVNAIPFNSYQEAQESKKIKTKQVTAAVIDFLLRNPKTADKMKTHEKIALDIIGDLLTTQDQREHELGYATAGRSQLTINTTDSRQAQFVKDESGNIYLVLDGVVHPIAQELVNQARNIPTIENATLSPYNLGGLESMFNSHPMESVTYNYRAQKGGEYLSDIAKKFDVPASNVFYKVDVTGDWAFKSKYVWRPIKERKKIWENKKKISKRDRLWIVKEKYKNEISAVFSYKWHRDLNNDGVFNFNEFNQIKRTFYNDEDFNIGIHYQTEKGFTGNLEVKILEDNTGKLIWNEKTNITLSNGGPMISGHNIPARRFPIGIYLIHTNLNDDIISRTISSSSERFEIIQNPSKTTEQKY